jgi:hypothetical protein
MELSLEIKGLLGELRSAVDRRNDAKESLRLAFLNRRTFLDKKGDYSKFDVADQRLPLVDKTIVLKVVIPKPVKKIVVKETKRTEKTKKETKTKKQIKKTVTKVTPKKEVKRRKK